MRNLAIFTAAAALLLGQITQGEEGSYQRTKDHRTIVWNNDPKPGDAAEWSGRRDQDGYASGYGTLTWFSSQQLFRTGSNLSSVKYNLIGRYYGNMTAGRFEGLVTTTGKNGKPYHATFVSGQKNSEWLPGSTPKPGEGERRLAEKKTNNEHRTADARPMPTQSPITPAPPAEGPSKPQVATHSPPPLTNVPESKPPGPSSEKPASNDNALRSLTMPPASLRNLSVTPSPIISGEVKGTAASSQPRLTTSEAIDLANAEARAQGFQLEGYERPEAKYTIADDTWSISYSQKSGGDSNDLGKHFTISVGDKTKKASVISMSR